MRGLRSLAALPALGAAAIALGGAPALSAPREEPASLRDLLRTWTRPVATLPAATSAPSSSRLDALNALAGGGLGGSRCASSLFLALHQNDARLNQPTRRLLDRAAARHAPDAARFFTPDGEFVLHYGTDPASLDAVESYDGDLSGVPDGVERLAAALADVRADFLHVLKWPPISPPALGSGRDHSGPVDVYLVGLRGPAGGPDGFTLPLAPEHPPGGETVEASAAAIFLDAGLAAGPGAADRAVLVHHVAHLVLLGESSRESVWWHEASASWLEDRLEGTAPATASRFGRAQVGRRGAGLGDEGLGYDVASFLWPHYLALSRGAGVDLMRRLWLEMAGVAGNNTFEAMDRTLRRLYDSSLAEEVRAFNVWNLFLGQADTGGRYPFARFLQTPEGDGTYDLFPARGGALAGPIAPMGSALLRLLGDGTPGGLRIRFNGDPTGAWDVSLVVYSTPEPGQVNLVPVEVDAGAASLAVPWRGLAAVDVLIQNLSAPGAPAAAYAFAIDYDPTVPFDLLRFTADASGRGALLNWSTESEDRLAGWNVYRGPAPLGPFTRINSYLLPAAGAPGLPMSYVFLDAEVGTGRKYYYHIEGITLEGFSELSHATAIRIGRPPRATAAP